MIELVRASQLLEKSSKFWLNRFKKVHTAQNCVYYWYQFNANETKQNRNVGEKWEKNGTTKTDTFNIRKLNLRAPRLRSNFIFIGHRKMAQCDRAVVPKSAHRSIANNNNENLYHYELVSKANFQWTTKLEKNWWTTTIIAKCWYEPIDTCQLSNELFFTHFSNIIWMEIKLRINDDKMKERENKKSDS